MLEGNRQVTVSIRVRPKLENALNEAHRGERYEKLACTATSETDFRLWDGKPGKESRTCSFSFDNIFPMDTPQEDLYEASALDAVDAVLAGTNSSILAYGQTGSGKTYTVLGGIGNNPLSRDVVTEDTGVLMRVIEDLLQFAARMREKKQRHVVIGISVVEIYLDEIRDLLNPKSAQGTVVTVALMRDVMRLPGLTYTALETLTDAMEVYQRAAGRRVQRATSANDTSSRSHAVFSIEVFQTPYSTLARPSLTECLQARDAYVAASLDPQQRAVAPVRSAVFAAAANPLIGSPVQPIMHTRLTIADLAGSEKAKNSNVHGAGFEELRKINASLTSLGNVVHCLFEAAKHIPYRDSKLTMVLRDSFASPGARIALIVNVSPTVLTFEETLSSLYFADKVKAMKVKSLAPASDTAAEEAYLVSLRAHDAILAEMHICACENELEGRDTMLLARAAAQFAANNPLFEPTLHIAVPGGIAKSAALAALRTRVKADAASSYAAARQQRFVKEQHRAVKEEELIDYLAARSATKKELKEVAEVVAAAQAAEREREEGMVRVLAANHADFTAARTRRQGLESRAKNAAEQRAATEALEAQVRSAMKALEKELGADCPPLRPSNADARVEWSQDDAWRELELRGPEALELARLREQWADLYLANRLSQESPAAEQQQQQQRKRCGRRPSQHADPAFLAPVDPNRAPKYWTQKRLVEEEQKRRPLRHSAYDDPKLAETIAAFMHMGGCMRHMGRDGKLHRRLFYVVERHGRKRLCWDEEAPADQQFLRLGGLGHVDLRSVTAIILGRSTPTFAKCESEVDFFTAFSLEYAGSSSSSSSRKHLDLLCGSVQELETWVIGLSQATGLSPRYASASEPDGRDPADPAAASLSREEASLAQEWFIPAATIADARAQIEARRLKRASQRMAITPGQLSGVTKLDVFRASALWAYFFHCGMVDNPSKQLYCYADCERAETAGNSPAATMDVSDSATTSGRPSLGSDHHHPIEA